MQFTTKELNNSLKIGMTEFRLPERSTHLTYHSSARKDAHLRLACTLEKGSPFTEDASGRLCGLSKTWFSVACVEG